MKKGIFKEIGFTAKQIWYLIFNLFMAMTILSIGQKEINLNDVFILLVSINGIVLFLSIFRDGPDSTGISIFTLYCIFGIVAPLLVDWVTGNEKISYYFSCIVVLYIAKRQIEKVKEREGKGFLDNVLPRILALIYPLTLVAAIILSVFFEELELHILFFRITAIVWIIRTIYVVILRFKYRRIINEYNNRKYASSANENAATVSQADISVVKENMESLVRSLSGDYNLLEGNLKVSYSTEVSVREGEIEFIISGVIDGNKKSLKSVNDLNKCKIILDKKNKEYSNFILNKAINKLKSLNPDSNYSVSVKMGSISDETLE